MDPHRITAHNDALILVQMFEGLMGRDETYSKIIPVLAEKYEISKDGKTYTFTLKSGLKWSNGEPLTMEQVRSSLIRAIWPEVGNQYSSWWTDYIVGAKDFVENYSKPTRKEFEDKIGIRLKGKNQLVITLTHASVTFLNFLTQPQMAVVHPSMYDPNSKAWRTPDEYITNGAYKLEKWAVNDRVVMVKNQMYRDAPKVKIQKITALAINDENATLNLFNKNQIDWTGENSLSSTRVPALRSEPSFRINPYFATGMWLFNVKHKPFDDVRVRKALTFAIHRAELTDKVLKGGQVPTHRLVPPGILGYQPELKGPPPFDKQIEEAKKLLAEAGFPNGKNWPKVGLVYNINEQNHRTAQAIQQMWKKYLNIEVVLQNMEWKVFVTEQEAGKLDISRQTWVGDFPDPAQMLEIFVSDNGNNRTRWKNAKFDELVKGADSVMDHKKRMKRLAEAEAIFMTEWPAAPTHQSVYFSLIGPQVQNFKPNMFGLYEFKYLSKK
jgi:oligopeptide transport system substrate-binding protein